MIDLSNFSSPWIKAFKCWIKKTLAKPFEISVTFPFATNSLDNFVTTNEVKAQSQSF
ncbi:MAG: hypothetical protein WCG25_07540 [bacterium]